MRKRFHEGCSFRLKFMPARFNATSCPFENVCRVFCHCPMLRRIATVWQSTSIRESNLRERPPLNAASSAYQFWVKKPNVGCTIRWKFQEEIAKEACAQRARANLGSVGHRCSVAIIEDSHQEPTGGVVGDVLLSPSVPAITERSACTKDEPVTAATKTQRSPGAPPSSGQQQEDFRQCGLFPRLRLPFTLTTSLQSSVLCAAGIGPRHHGHSGLLHCSPGPRQSSCGHSRSAWASQIQPPEQ
jgi:hypothetical protein